MKNYSLLDLLIPFGPIFFSVLMLHVGRIPVSAVQDQSMRNKIPAIFAIGDSLVDTGNNNHIILTVARSNFPPYGRDFVGHKATGRFSNGKLVIDFIASKLGIKEMMPAYFELGLNISDFLTGVSFASAATGLDDLTSDVSFGIPISKQLKFLEETLEMLKVKVGRDKVEHIISEALFYVNSGNNDYLVTYFNSPLRSFQYNISAYAHLLVQSSSHIVKELYRMGARKIVLVGTPVLGCTPSQRTLHGRPKRDCDKDLNTASLEHNFQLLKEIEKLDKELQGCKVIYADLYSILLDIILNFKQYGFEEESLGCCGTGTIETGLLCNQFIPSCKNASTHIFWDSLHTTDRANEMIATGLVRDIITKLR